MAASGKGFRTIFALVPATVWGDAVLAAAGHGFAAGPGGEGIGIDPQLIPDDTLEGRAVELEGELGNIVVSGDLPDVPAVFDTIHRHTAFAMGTAGVPIGPILTIREGFNDRLDFSEDTTNDFVALLTPGDYTFAQIAAEIQTQIAATAALNTYTFVEAAGVFTINRTAGVATVELRFGTGANLARSVATTIGFNAADKTGATTYSSDTTVVSTAFKHVLKINPDLFGLHFTLVIGIPGVVVKEITTAKYNGYTFNMPQGTRCNYSFPVIGHDGVVDDSGPNKLATLSGITRPGLRFAALFRQGRLRMNNQVAAALTDAERIFPNNFTQVLNNNLPGDDVTLKFGNLIDEPERDNKAQLSGAVSFSKLDDPADLIAAKLRQVKKIDLEVLGRVIAVDQTRYALRKFMPSVQFQVDSTASGPGRIPKTVNYVAQGVETVPAGFPAGYTDPVTIEVINTDTTDPLV